jgi:hypothetical protein
MLKKGLFLSVLGFIVLSGAFSQIPGINVSTNRGMVIIKNDDPYKAISVELLVTLSNGSREYLKINVPSGSSRSESYPGYVTNATILGADASGITIRYFRFEDGDWVVNVINASSSITAVSMEVFFTDGSREFVDCSVNPGKNKVTRMGRKKILTVKFLSYNNEY